MRSIEQKILNNSNYKNYTEVLINSVNSKIALSIYKSRPEHPSIIFLPGTMVHPLFYDDFLSSLAKENYNVIGVHFINHGKSPREIKKFEVNDLVQNTIDTISYTINEFGENVALMGSSQGGLIAVLTAAQDHRIKAVFPHNFFLLDLNETLSITNFPKFLIPFFKQIKWLISALSKRFPRKQIKLSSYLNIEDAVDSELTKKLFLTDSLSLKSYPLSFLASLFNCNTNGLLTGMIKCPVITISSTGDKLVPIEYMKIVHQKIVAPYKDMIIFEGLSHLFLVDEFEKVLSILLEKIDHQMK